MTHSIRRVGLNLGAMLLASAHASSAMAGCGAPALPGLHHKAAFLADRTTAAEILCSIGFIQWQFDCRAPGACRSW